MEAAELSETSGLLLVVLPGPPLLPLVLRPVPSQPAAAGLRDTGPEAHTHHPLSQMLHLYIAGGKVLGAASLPLFF